MRRIPSSRWRSGATIIALAFIYASVSYAILALRLLPSHDAYNGYVATFHPIISSLLNGKLLLWDPIPACGTPLYLAALTGGVLDPAFSVSILIGRLCSLNVLDTYWTWILLRNIPVLVGSFWLIRLHCRSLFCALLCTAFTFATLSFCLLRDHIVFVVYWPLLLASLTHFIRALKRGRFSACAFFLSLCLLAITLQLYNPAYTIVFVGSIAAARILVEPQSVFPLVKSLWLVKARFWPLGILMMLFLLSPSLVLMNQYRSGEYFAYIRTHQAADGFFHPSVFLKDPLAYMNVNPAASPKRELWELASCLFPFYYAGPVRMEGTLYFGFLGLMGVLASYFFRRSRAFLSCTLAALLVAFLMSSAADGVFRLLGPLFPFLKVMNQRHLLYPAFLLYMSVAGSMGMALLMERRLASRIVGHIRLWKTCVAACALLAAGILLLFLSGFSVRRDALCTGQALRLQVAFLLSVAGGVGLLKNAFQGAHRYYAYGILCLAVFLADLSFYLGDLSRHYHRNSGVLAKCAMLRQKQPPQYQPYRAPLAPMMYGTDVYSVAHLLNVWTALPAYWHCDIVFTTERYYQIISSLPPDKLKHVLGIDVPVIRTYARSVLLNDEEDAITRIERMGANELVEVLVLEEPTRPAPDIAKRVEQRMLTATPTRRRIPGNTSDPRVLQGMRESFYMSLYDHRTDITTKGCEEIAPGVYHRRMFRLPLDLPLPTREDGQVDPSSCFFPDFPWLGDVDGKICFLSNGGYLTGNPTSRSAPTTLMRVIPEKGFLLECEDSPVTPRMVFSQKERRPRAPGVKAVAMQPNQVIIHTEQPTETVLYYSDLYDSNWTATVDGQPTRIFIANGAFKAVKLPAGGHQVVFRYQVPHLHLALTAYLVCMACFGLVFLATSVCARSHHRCHN